MTTELVPTTKEELIHYLEQLAIPDHLRATRDQIILQLKNEAPNFPADKKTAKKEVREFLPIVHEYLSATPKPTHKSK